MEQHAASRENIQGHCVCLPARCAWKSRIASRRNRIGRTCVGSARWENGDEWKTGWQGHRQYPPVPAPIAIIAVACSLRPPCLGTSECAQVQKQADPRRRRRVGRVLAPGVLDTRVCVRASMCVRVCVYWCADCNDDDIHSAVRVRFVRFSGRILLHGPFRWCGVLDVRACVCVCIAVAAVPAFVGHTGCWQAVGIRVLLLWCFPNIRTTTTTTRRIREVEAIFECFECLVCVLAARSSPATPRTPTRRVCLCNTTCRRRRRPTTAVGWTVPRVALERARVSACVCVCVGVMGEKLDVLLLPSLPVTVPAPPPIHPRSWCRT